jgi:hypothetical protein
MWQRGSLAHRHSVLRSAPAMWSPSTPSSSDTMERECDVHRDFLRAFGIAPKEPERVSVPVHAGDGLELF